MDQNSDGVDEEEDHTSMEEKAKCSRMIYDI